MGNFSSCRKAQLSQEENEESGSYKPEKHGDEKKPAEGAETKPATGHEDTSTEKSEPVEVDDVKAELSNEADSSSGDTSMGGKQNKEVEKVKAVTAHVKALGPSYPGADVKKVEPKEVSWDKTCDYVPISYTNPKVLEKPVWADPDEGDPEFANIKFNEVDGNVNRVSHMGPYKVVDGKPRNPVGRTGMQGRGLLGKWGPNHAADPVVTRWKHTETGQIAKHENGRPILEVVSILRRDTEEWALPGGMVDNGERVSVTLKREFGEEALNTLEESEKAETRENIDKLFHNGNLIYKGYVDDPRNTDNAWMETEVVNFHDDDGTTVGKIPLSAGDDAKAVRWLPIDHKLDLYASHADFLKETCKNLGAYFFEE